MDHHWSLGVQITKVSLYYTKNNNYTNYTTNHYKINALVAYINKK